MAALQADSLVETEAERVDGGERHAAHRMSNDLENGAHFSGAQDDRQHAGPMNAQEVEDRRVALHRAEEEETKRVNSDVELASSCA